MRKELRRTWNGRRNDQYGPGLVIFSLRFVEIIAHKISSKSVTDSLI